MGEGQVRGGVGRGAALIMGILGLLILVAGCRAKGPGTGVGFSEPMAQGRQFDAAEESAKKVGGSAAAIASACAKEPYANASKGMIVAETGLHEDVFELRDRVSYKAVPYGLNEALRLEVLLRKEAGGSEHSSYPVEQATCIRQFADHMQTLTDPLVEADAVQKQLDVSAFNNASKEAQQETEQEEKAIEPPASGHKQ